MNPRAALRFTRGDGERWVARVRLTGGVWMLCASGLPASAPALRERGEQENRRTGEQESRKRRGARLRPRAARES